jgi:peptidoglycan/xylan/chitin deacetylase (PgdA/CDA1 family)
MLADELRQLSRIPGMTIGGHTVNHLALPDQPPDVQEREVAECSAALTSIVGRPVELFAYPYGAIDRRSAAHIRRSQRWGLSCDTGRLGDSFDAARVPRLEMKGLELPAFGDVIERVFADSPALSLPTVTRRPE